MINIFGTATPSYTQWWAAVLGMRNPRDSWDKSDSVFTPLSCVLGDNDLKLAKSLCRAGSDHRKFMRMLTIHTSMTAPRFFYHELDTYKVGTVCNSCSTMNRITADEFTEEDFSCDNLTSRSRATLGYVINELNYYRSEYLKSLKGESELHMTSKQIWRQLIELLPQSYNQTRTMMFNYETLLNIYHARKNHKLEEWHDFCRWIEDLPYSELITGDNYDG